MRSEMNVSETAQEVRGVEQMSVRPKGSRESGTRQEQDPPRTAKRGRRQFSVGERGRESGTGQEEDPMDDEKRVQARRSLGKRQRWR